MIKSWKETNTEDKNGTTETRNSTTNTLNSNTRPNSRLRFKRINITKRFKKLENLNAVANITNKKILYSKHKITKAPSLNLNSNIYRADLNNFLNFEKWRKDPCVWGECIITGVNSEISSRYTQRLSENQTHERSMASRHTSIFDQNQDTQLWFKNNKSVESNCQIEEKLKRLGKILSRHQRIESVINHIDPLNLSRKRP